MFVGIVGDGLFKNYSSEQNTIGNMAADAFVENTSALLMVCVGKQQLISIVDGKQTIISNSTSIAVYEAGVGTNVVLNPIRGNGTKIVIRHPAGNDIAIVIPFPRVKGKRYCQNKCFGGKFLYEVVLLGGA